MRITRVESRDNSARSVPDGTWNSIFIWGLIIIRG